MNIQRRMVNVMFVKFSNWIVQNCTSGIHTFSLVRSVHLFSVLSSLLRQEWFSLCLHIVLHQKEQLSSSYWGDCITTI
jgi:hypothetical protein